MKHSEQDLGTVTVLLERMAKQSLPRMLEIKERVDKGECLDSMDMEFLQHILQDANQNRQYVDKFPEHAELVKNVANLYQQITSKALENEKRRGK